MTADSRTTPQWLAPMAMGTLAIALALSVTREAAATTGMPVVWFLLTAYVGLRHRQEGWVPTIFVPSAVLFVKLTFSPPGDGTEDPSPSGP